MFAFLRRLSLSFVAVLLVGGAATPIAAQFANRIAAQPDLKSQKQLSGHIPSWANTSALATKSVDLSAPLHLFVFLKRDPAAQAAFDQLTADQQNPGSPQYHQWLTAQQIGERYGATSDDIAAISSWLSGQGLSVLPLGPTRVSIEATGTASAVANAFHTNFGYYTVGEATRFSASTEPTIPAAFSPVVASIGGLTEEVLKPQHTKKLASRPDYALSNTRAAALTPEPQFTYGSGEHFLTPGDFGVIYDINPLYTAGNTGGSVGAVPQHVAILGRSQVALSDINGFANFSGLTSFHLNPLIASPGFDPGLTGTDDQDEATLDVDRVIGTANGAQADLVLASTASGGITTDINYNINVLFDPVMTISFGACEATAAQVGVMQYDSLFQVAAAEGISTFVSSGDSGVAGCTDAFVSLGPPPFPIIGGINYLCSSSYVTCVGGTEFNDASGAGYWSSANGAGHVSAQSYIPEGAWNEPNDGGGFWLSSSGGGPSLYINKPTWQVGVTPADGSRDTPDISFSAAGHDGYYACLDYALKGAGTCVGGDFFAFAGTSASAPGMAGIAALLNTKLGARQGNLNPLIYHIYGTTPAAFHDATPASSGVVPCDVAIPSMCNNSTASDNGLTGGLAGFALATGYDEATGLGSLDVNSFVNAAVGLSTAPKFSITPTVPALTIPAGATTGNTETITFISINNFSGTVGLTCKATSIAGSAAGTCSLSPSSLTLAAGGSATGTLTILPANGTSGTMDVVITGTSGSTLVASSIVVTVSAPITTFTLTPASSTLTFTAGATTGNSDVITVASSNGFSGGVTLGCSITLNTGPATVPPTCTMSPNSVTLSTVVTSATSTATIGSQASTSDCISQNSVPTLPWKFSGGVFAAFALILIPLRKRKSFRGLLALGLLGLGMSLVSGCGNGVSGRCATYIPVSTTTGVYTVTVTGTSSGASVTKTFTVNIQ
ncbi:MAG TPA: protease pro-enzyme activation domain-containing protein [Acidobacteriaceae bacterium]|jgi:subtilase family serine protease